MVRVRARARAIIRFSEDGAHQVSGMAALMRSGQARVAQGEEMQRKLEGRQDEDMPGWNRIPSSSPRTGRVLEGFKSQWSMSFLSVGSSPKKGGQDGACPMST